MYIVTFYQYFQARISCYLSNILSKYTDFFSPIIF